MALNLERWPGESDKDYEARRTMANAREPETPRPPTRDSDKEEMDRYVEYLRDAMQEASGWKREELKQRLEDAEADRKAREKVANIQADASKYGADKSYAASIYGSDNSLKGSQYSADRQYDSTKYSTDAGERNSQRTLQGNIYQSDASLAGTRYSSDTDRYKFDADQANQRADRALKFLETYTNLSQRPDDYLQASNYARLGRQVEGMPVMVQELLGQINPTAQSRAGSTANMPLNAAVATFGNDPLHLVSERSAATPAPQMYYPTQPGPVPGTPTSVPPVGTPQVPGYPSFLSVDTLNAAGDQLTAAVNSGQLAPEAAQAQWLQLKAQFQGGQQAGYAAPPIPGQSQAYYAPPVPGQPVSVGTDYATKYNQVQGVGQQGYATDEGQFGVMGAPDEMPAYPSSQGQMRPNWSQEMLSASSAQPRGVRADLAPPNPDGQDALRQAGRTLLARGAHTLGNQQRERMSKTDIGLTNSALKDAGGVPDDYWLTYDRTRIGNDGSMAAA